MQLYNGSGGKSQKILIVTTLLRRKSAYRKLPYPVSPTFL
ncbi:hypothetical protein SP19_100 [Salmonella phage 19]|nr:hypothetical protein SP19_100 [Salmonella phage 19]